MSYRVHGTFKFQRMKKLASRMKFCIVIGILLESVQAQLLTYPWLDIPKLLGNKATSAEREVKSHKFKGGRLTISEPSGLCDPAVKQYSGYFSITDTNKKYFYWFFESRSDPSSSPTVAWLTGGPGCSSMLALFGENGPCTVNKEGSDTTLNPHSWNTVANMLWIDQPAGTGFSQGDYDSGETEVADDMLGFLLAFFEALPEYNTQFYIFGESYAGHYIPAIAHRLYLHNKDPSSKHLIDFKGIGIGNGLTSPEEQYKWYPEMAFNSSSAPQVVTEAEYNEMQSAVSTCTGLIKVCNAFDKDTASSNPACIAAMMYCNMKLMMPYQKHGMNPYDMRLKCEHEPLCYDFSEIGIYLNDPSVRKALGVDPSAGNWDECNKAVNINFVNDFMKNFDYLIPDLLEAGIPVLVYVGDQDFICNWIGNKHWVLELEWSGKSEMNNAEDFLLKSDTGAEVGKVRYAKNIFYFLQVFQAGHMVPMDQPENALFMFKTFLERGGKMGFADEGTVEDVHVEVA